jgi:hypothetical protein
MTVVTHASPAARRTHTDDISSGFETLQAWPLQAAFVADAWPAFLEEEAELRSSKEARAALDAHLSLAYLAAKKPELAIAMLEQSERDFSADPNPPARLAKVYRATFRHTDALAAIQRARKLVTGPRTLRVLTEQAEIQSQLTLKREAYLSYQEIARYVGWLPASGVKLRQSALEQVSSLASSAESQAPQSIPGYMKCTRDGDGIQCGEEMMQARCEAKESVLNKISYRMCLLHGPYGGAKVRTHDLPELGCRQMSQRVLAIADKDGGALLTTQAEVQKTFRIERASDAIQLVRILTRIDADKPGRTASASGKGPYSVLAYETHTCGCDHPIEQIGVTVGLDGSVREKSRKVIARTQAGLCVD